MVVIRLWVEEAMDLAEDISLFEEMALICRLHWITNSAKSQISLRT